MLSPLNYWTDDHETLHTCCSGTAKGHRELGRKLVINKSHIFVNFLVNIICDKCMFLAKQGLVVEYNLLATMQKDSPKEKYDGYGACPLVTSYNTVILAEFIYGGVPHETMPFDQVKLHVRLHRYSLLSFFLILIVQWQAKTNKNLAIKWLPPRTPKLGHTDCNVAGNHQVMCVGISTISAYRPWCEMGHRLRFPTRGSQLSNTREAPPEHVFVIAADLTPKLI